MKLVSFQSDATCRVSARWAPAGLALLVILRLAAPVPAEARTPVPREDLLCPLVTAEARSGPRTAPAREGDKRLPAIRVSSFDIEVAVRDANPLYLAGGDGLTLRNDQPYDRIPGPTSVDHLTFDQLLALGAGRRGAAADGVSQLLLVLKAALPGRFAGDLPAGGGPDGTLRLMRNGETCAWKDHHYAFAVYTPPAYFGRAPRNLDSRVGRAQARDIGVSLRFSPTGRDRPISKTVPLKLVRPPVVLVHGLFDNAVDAWLTPSTNNSTLPAFLDLVGYETFLVDYFASSGRGGNPSSFQDNRFVLWTNGRQDPGVQVPLYQAPDPRSGRDPKTGRPVYRNPDTGEQANAGGIRQALSYYRDVLGIAAARADVIGHSMGGVVARVYASDALPPTWAADRETCRGRTRSADARYAREPYNPHYRRPDNFGAGDINRLITVGTPHHGSGQTRLFEFLTDIKVNNEGWTSYGTRTLAKYGVYFLAGVHAKSPAMQELKLQSCGLRRIGATRVPSHVVVAATRPGGQKDPVHDPGGEYLGTLNYVGGLLYYFPEILDHYLADIAPDWKHDPAWYRRFTDGSIRAALDDLMELEARYWTNLRREIEDYYLELGGIPKVIQDKYWSYVPKGLDDARRPRAARRPAEEPTVPYVTLEALRALMFRFEKNDSTVRVDSQSAGLDLNTPFVTYIARDDFKKTQGVHIKESMLHRHTIRDGRVHRRLDQLLRAGPSLYAESLPPAGQPLPGRKPPPGFAVDWKLSGSFAVKWSGIPFSHAEAIRQAAVGDTGTPHDDVVIMVRPVNPDSTALILQGAATKGMNVKGKSSNWGPQRGYIPVRQRFSKLWRLGPGGRAKITEFDGKTRELLSAVKPIYKTADGAPIAIDRQLEHCWPVPCAQAAKDRSDTVTYTVWADPDGADAENAVYFCKGAPANGDAEASDAIRKKVERPCDCGAWYDWRNAPPDPAVAGSTGEFDLTVPPPNRKDPPSCGRLRPLRVLADNTGQAKAFLTADYDLLATGFNCPKGKATDHPACKAVVKVADGTRPKGHECGDSRLYTNAAYGPGLPPTPMPCFDPQTGLITEAQKDLLDRINSTIETVAGYKGGKLSHHGPETNFFASPYVDYPITVFDPRGPAGEPAVVAIPRGPEGFRDIHLKRYYEKKIRQGFWLYPNTFDEANWHWLPRGTPDDWQGWYYEDHPDLAGSDDVEELPKPRCVADEVARRARIRAGETAIGEPVACTPEDRPAANTAPRTAGPPDGGKPADTLAAGGGGGGGPGSGPGSGGAGGGGGGKVPVFDPEVLRGTREVADAIRQARRRLARNPGLVSDIAADPATTPIDGQDDKAHVPFFDPSRYGDARDDAGLALRRAEKHLYDGDLKAALEMYETAYLMEKERTRPDSGRQAYIRERHALAQAALRRRGAGPAGPPDAAAKQPIDDGERDFAATVIDNGGGKPVIGSRNKVTKVSVLDDTGKVKATIYVKKYNRRDEDTRDLVPETPENARRKAEAEVMGSILMNEMGQNAPASRVTRFADGTVGLVTRAAPASRELKDLPEYELFALRRQYGEQRIIRAGMGDPDGHYGNLMIDGHGNVWNVDFDAAIPDGLQSGHFGGWVYEREDQLVEGTIRYAHGRVEKADDRIRAAGNGGFRDIEKMVRTFASYGWMARADQLIRYKDVDGQIARLERLQQRSYQNDLKAKFIAAGVGEASAQAMVESLARRAGVLRRTMKKDSMFGNGPIDLSFLFGPPATDTMLASAASLREAA